MADRMRTQSGRQRKINAAKKALLVVMKQLSDDAEVGVLALNSRGQQGHWIIPLGPLDRTELSQAIQQIRADWWNPIGPSDEGRG